uniref:Uncharacterized protein n=1 Tax=Oryza sativa subsp. japonica TaxID=39947 RepID=Q75H68_ORYSJ|nr:hypothetical protein [Oryza sativa Japonica Group]
MIANGHPDMLQVGCVSHAGHMRRTCNKPTLALPQMVEWLSYDYYLVLDQRCSDSPITSTSTKLISGSVLVQPRQVKGLRALSSENDSPTTRLGLGRVRDESVISDLAGHKLEEEDYPVIDYELDLQTAMESSQRARRMLLQIVAQMRRGLDDMDDALEPILDFSNCPH